MSLTVRAAAKINLLLGVGAPRPDGFHTLVTVYQAVSLYDDLTVSASEELTVSTDVAAYIDASHLPGPGHNIVDRAASALAAHHERALGAEVRIDKAIPIAGGWRVVPPTVRRHSLPSTACTASTPPTTTS